MSKDVTETLLGVLIIFIGAVVVLLFISHFAESGSVCVDGKLYLHVDHDVYQYANVRCVQVQ